MIFAIWLVFIILEAIAHDYIIEVAKFDPTPDNKFSFSKLGVVISRIGAYLGFWWLFGVHNNAEFWCYTIAALAMHLLVFPVLLNFLRGKQPHYLGNGGVDRILKWFPPLVRWTWLLFISVGFIYAYYNTDLL